MIGEQRYAVDTVALISYFNNVFDDGESKISQNARRIIDQGFDPMSSTKLIIPSIVFMEIFYKFLTSKEFSRKFQYEIFLKIKESPDIEIKPIEKEVLESFIKINDAIIQLEHNDKLILSCAMQLKCPLITIDPEIIKYVKNDAVIPAVII